MNKHYLKHQPTIKIKILVWKYERFVYLTVSGLIHARSGCFRLLQRGKRYEFERSPIKSRFEPSSTDAFICSSFGSVKLRINYREKTNILLIDLE